MSGVEDFRYEYSTIATSSEPICIEPYFWEPIAGSDSYINNEDKKVANVWKGKDRKNGRKRILPPL